MAPSLLRGRILSALVVLIAVSCDAAEPGVAAIPLSPLASAPAPLSRNADVTLATEEMACVIDDYQSRIHCIHRDGGQEHVFGRRGQGPGEFRNTPRDIIRGPDGTIGVLSVNSMAVFEPSGALVSDVRFPGVFSPIAPFDSAVTGAVIDIKSRSPIKLEYRHLEVDVGTGDILWERVFPADLVDEAQCARPSRREGASPPTSLGPARMLSSGAMSFHACPGRFLFIADRNDDTGTLVQPPLYTPEYPGQKDVERYLERCGPPSPMFFRAPCEVDGFRSRAKSYSVHAWGDEQDRLWVLTNRDREEFSYFDVYNGPEFAGSVRVRHRGMSFNVLGSTLVVLVERPVASDDPDGLPDRGIDWYGIDGLAFGSRE